MKQLIRLNLTLLTAVSMALLLPSSAHSGTSKKKAKPAVRNAKPAVRNAKKAAAKSTPKRVKTYDFTGDELEADRLRPEGTDIYQAGNAKHKSLIRLRTNFISAVLKSADDL